MNARQSKPSTTPFGLIAWLSNTRIHLPLIHVETRFRVTGEVLSVEMDQIFEQTARESLDVTYTFPLPAQAAVHRCEMIINGRTIRAVVMEDREARKMVKVHKAMGHRTALVEMNRENLFTLELGNVAPGDRIMIRFAYFERLDRLGAELSLRIPFSPGVRYIPGKPLLRANRGRGTVDDTDQVPDASLLTPPRIDGSHPDAATMYVHGVFDAAEVELRTLSSPTHPVVVRPASELIEVELCGEEHVPANDLVVRWEQSAVGKADLRSWTCSHDGHAYALIQLRAPEMTALGADDNSVQDIYFLVDRSGSMQGDKWVKCAEALHAFVRELGPRDRVWITCFESEYQDFSDVPMTRDELLGDAGFQTLAQIGTGGGTELLPALLHVLDMHAVHPSDNRARIILLTDGQVGNEPEILDRMKCNDAAGITVHCFGIDHAVNDAFLKSLAAQTRGRCVLMTPDDDIPGAVRRLSQSLRRPVLRELLLNGDAVSADESVDLPDLHAGEVTLLALRSDAGRRTVVEGRLPDGSEWSQSISFTAEVQSDVARLLWARRRCLYLLEAGRKSEAVAVAVRHNIVCQGASFVACDGAEIVSVASREVVQPSQMLPAAGGLQFCMDAVAQALPPMRKIPFSRRPPREMNFFEQKVTDYQTRRELNMDCSDEELVGPIHPLTLSKDEQIAGGLLAHYGRMERVPEHTRLGAWAHAFCRQLVAVGMPRLVATVIAIILHKWGGEFISSRRERLLVELQSRVTTGQPPLEAVAAFVEAHVTGSERKDLEPLLAIKAV